MVLCVPFLLTSLMLCTEAQQGSDMSNSDFRVYADKHAEAGARYGESAIDGAVSGAVGGLSSGTPSGVAAGAALGAAGSVLNQIRKER